MFEERKCGALKSQRVEGRVAVLVGRGGVTEIMQRPDHIRP